VALADEGLLQVRGVDHHQIDVAVATQLQRLTGAHRDDVDRAATLLLERRQQLLEQAGVLGGGGGGQLEALRLLGCSRGRQHGEDEQQWS